MPVFCLSLDSPNPGFNASFESWVFSEASKDITAITTQLKITNHFVFFSLEAQNDLCPPEYQETETPWFDAQEGIGWLEAVIGYLRAHPTSVKKSEMLIADFEECAGVLRKAKEIGAKFHFWMDI